MLELINSTFLPVNTFLKKYLGDLDLVNDTLLYSPFKQEYVKIVIFFTIALALCLILGLAAYAFSLGRIKDNEKLSEYECGFEPFDNATRLPFDVHFYIVGILFLIFDVEIALLFPWVLGLSYTGLYGFFTMLCFLVLLSIGFVYEWRRGALLWPHKIIQQIR